MIDEIDRIVGEEFDETFVSIITQKTDRKHLIAPASTLHEP